MADGSAVVWGSVPGPDLLGVVVDPAVAVEPGPAVAVEPASAVAVEPGPAVAVEPGPAVAVVPGPAVAVVGPCWCTLEVAARGAGEGRTPYAT